MKKVSLLGPTSPWRGGIARHTTSLHRELRQRVELQTIGFRRQYPSWLFPGRFQHEPGYENHVEPGVDYLLDSLSPRTWRAVRDRVLAFRPDLVILPWWTTYWAPLCRAILPAFRAAGIEIELVCHNVIEHESSPMRRWLTRRVLALADRLITQAPDEAERLRGWFPNAHVDYLPHPPYPAATARTALPRRAALELLFFGLVRPYKGLDTLLAALRQLSDLDLHLAVVGEWWRPARGERTSIEHVQHELPITVVDRYVSEEEAAAYFNAADAVILPYHRATGSGVLALAHAYRKPTIVTSVGGLPDQVRDGENGYIIPPDDPDALARAIRALPRLPPHPEFPVPNSWAQYVERLL